MAKTQTAGVEGILVDGHKGFAVEVPFDPAIEWGTQQCALWPGRRGYPVEVILNGVRFRSAIVSRMRRLFVLVDETVARRAGVAIGNPVRLAVKADVALERTKAQRSKIQRDKSVRTIKPSQP